MTYTMPRRAPNRPRVNAASVIGTAFLRTVLNIALTFFWAWMLMLLLGGFASETGHSVFAISYWASFIAIWILRLVAVTWASIAATINSAYNN